MPDDIAITAGSGTTVATDLVSSRHFQRVKVVHGADGTASDACPATPLPVELVPTGAGGSTPYYLTSAASTNLTAVKASAGKLYSFEVTNTNAAVRYIRFYNKASAPVIASDSALIVAGYAVPGNGGIVVPVANRAFSTGIAFSLSTSASDTGGGSVAADELKVSLGYV